MCLEVSDLKRGGAYKSARDYAVGLLVLMDIRERLFGRQERSQNDRCRRKFLDVHAREVPEVEPLPPHRNQAVPGWLAEASGWSC